MQEITKKITGYAVVEPGKSTAKGVAEGGFTAEADRRLQIKNVPGKIEDVLYLERRPASEAGHPARVYMVDAPAGRFPLVISQTEGDRPWMFEVWVPGEAPRDMRALAKNLSMDMRARDRAWLKLKLDALLGAEGTPFTLTLPDGTTSRVESDAAALATLVLWRGKELGAFDDIKQTPLVDAMMSKKEPKTTAEGSASWSFDVKNAAVDDDFYLTIKEATLPDGTIRPVSVWLAGKYPRSLDALCKALSMDLRVYPVAWALKKLDQLIDIEEPNGGFLGPVPGSAKQQWYPSTVAYIATLIRHRLSVLGLLPKEGELRIGPALQLVAVNEAKVEPVAERPRGELCGKCNTYAVIRLDGCKTCQECGWSACG